MEGTIQKLLIRINNSIIKTRGVYATLAIKGIFYEQ